MPLVARASKTVRNKNLLIILMCALFMAWFAYDAFLGWPAANDRFVGYMRDVALRDGRVDASFGPELDKWPGWNKADTAARKRMDDIVNARQNRLDHSAWKSPFDIQLQILITGGLVAMNLAAVWWFVHCQRRRAIAEETTVSPANGIVVPWDRITQVDNSRWHTTGIVEITFVDDQGNPRRAKFDDYELEREPLVEILQQLAEKAVKAEFIPKAQPVETQS